MANQAYRVLLDDIRLLALLPASTVSYELTHLSIRGVDFSLYVVDGNVEDHLLIHCDMSLPPMAHREVALECLLDVNYYLFGVPRTCSFSRNPQTLHILMSVAQSLFGLTGKAVLSPMAWLADYALGWRDTLSLSVGQADRSSIFILPRQAEHRSESGLARRTL